MKIGTMETLGALIRERRQAANLDIPSAAARAGVGRRLLLELEAGKRPNVSFSTVLRLLALYGLSIEVVPRGLPGATAADSETAGADRS